ncbi:MAG: hypothetical protein J6U49_03855 [Alistipes sp.]|nr:hypothetical protein [Alistipes sp.]MBQ5829582.1 hypothetical protein [Alistipes sp.]
MLVAIIDNARCSKRYCCYNPDDISFHSCYFLSLNLKPKPMRAEPAHPAPISKKP